MARFLEEISPLTVGEDRLGLSLGIGNLKPRAFSGVEVLIDYARALPEGVVTPLLFSVTPPTLANYEERLILRKPPASMLFVPKEGGIHLIRVGELFHHRWFGTLTVEVEGDPLSLEASSG